VFRAALFVLFIIAAIVALRAAMVTMPYRVLETEFRRWEGMFYQSFAVAVVCVAVWIRLAGTRVQKTGGWFAGFALLLLFVFGAPGGAHSIILVKNLCIGQLRELDGAKEQWALANGKKDGEDVDIRAMAEFLKGKKIPECPKGGVYRIGKVGQTPRCSIAEHNLE
jgi:hypothetical protein